MNKNNIENKYKKGGIPKCLILSNGVALNGTVLLDKDLNATERNYLMIILFEIDINKIEGIIQWYEYLRNKPGIS